MEKDILGKYKLKEIWYIIVFDQDLKKNIYQIQKELLYNDIEFNFLYSLNLFFFNNIVFKYIMQKGDR